MNNFQENQPERATDSEQTTGGKTKMTKKETRRQIAVLASQVESKMREKFQEEYGDYEGTELYDKKSQAEEDTIQELETEDEEVDNYELFLKNWNVIKVGAYEMQSHFSEKTLRGDQEDDDSITYYERKHMINCPEEYERDKIKYNVLVRKQYEHIETAELLDSDSDNPLELELSSYNDELYWHGIISRFKATVYYFDKTVDPFHIQPFARPKLKSEFIKHHLKRLNEPDVTFLNHKSMEGTFNGKQVSCWAVHLIVYTRTINSKEEDFNYYEIYTEDWVYSILCHKYDLEKALKEITELHLSYSTVKNMIMTSQNHIKLEHAYRSFSNEWFRNVIPTPVHTALTETEEQMLVHTPAPKRKFIFKIVGYAALATIIPELSELHDVPKILAPVIEANSSETRAVLDLVKSCFAYTGDGDNPEAYIFPFKKNEDVDTRGCERRIITIDTSERSKKLKDKDAFAIAMSEYSEYIKERRRKVNYPHTWLPLCVGKQVWNRNEYLVLSSESLTENEVAVLSPIIRKLYRNALVGIGEGGNPQLLEYVTEYYREADRRCEQGGYKGSYKERMHDLIDACCSYMLRDNPNILNAEAPADESIAVADDEATTIVSPASLSKTEMTDQILNSINDMLASNSPEIIMDKPASAEQAKKVTFIYKTPQTLVLAVCKDMLSALISDKGYDLYSVDDFWNCCAERGITQCSKGENKFRALIQQSKVGVMALQLKGEPGNCRLKLPTA